MLWHKVLFGLSLVLNVALLGALVWGDQGIMAYRALKEQCLALDYRVKSLDEQNVALSREIRLLQSDEKYIEKMIRKRLNFVRDNEILYIFPEDPKAGAESDEAKN